MPRVERRWTVLGAAALALALALDPSVGHGDEGRTAPEQIHVYIRDRALGGRVRAAVVAAARRLARPGCARVFSEFADASGRSLREKLEELGETGPSYLSLIFFYKGEDETGCRNRHHLAFTAVGSRVIHVCPPFATNDIADIVVIHEALHSLGLPENPPSSVEITRHVLSRCGG